MLCYSRYLLELLSETEFQDLKGGTTMSEYEKWMVRLGLASLIVSIIAVIVQVVLALFFR